jgi:hypothetical protein
MTFKKMALAAAMSALIAPAFAADQVVDLSSGAASFVGSSPVLAGGDDTISFVNLAAGTYEFVLSISAQYITGLGGTFQGEAVNFVNFGKVSLGYLESTGETPFVLTLTGLPGSKALYSGELTVSAVPEPGTYALLLAGLGVVGAVARRRRNV